MSSADTAHRLFSTRPGPGLLVDVATAVVAFAVTLAMLTRHGSLAWHHAQGGLDLTGAALAASSTLPIIGWRRAPRLVFTATAIACILLVGLGYSLPLPLGAATALFLLAASRDEADRWTRSDTVLALMLLAGHVGAATLAAGEFPGSEVVHAALAWAVAWFAGERTRLLHEHFVELRERALRTDRDAERERRLALAEERARIARDLHDSAGHAINVIAVRAGAARMRHDEDPERSRDTLAAIEEIARETVEEIDQIVGALRDPGAENGDLTTPATLASLRTLVEHRAETGLDVTVETSGSPRALAPAVDVAAYRILQEGLTNAARHGADSAAIEVAFGEAALELTIVNPVAALTPPSANGGHGVIGMRERAKSLGGTLDIGRVEKTFRVQARLPYDPQPS